MDDLTTQLERLADAVERPREDDGTLARLVALMPCEPAIGDVAVACWEDSEGGELVELVRLDTGVRVDDTVALREALTLLSMVETMEELASFDELEPLADALEAWHVDDPSVPDDLARARANALAAVRALHALSPGDEPRVARPGVLDELGGALRELDKAWGRLEQAAESWSEARLAEHPGDEQVLSRVQALWRLLGVARRGPLARPASSALHDGREAGLAMAAAVSG